jgi:hypothetical protein
MEYICVKWIHDSPDQPLWLYSELNDERREVRKVEVFRGTRVGWADSSHEVGDTFLSLEPIPPLGEIVAQKEFEPKSITRDEFERVWADASASRRSK